MVLGLIWTEKMAGGEKLTNLDHFGHFCEFWTPSRKSPRAHIVPNPHQINHYIPTTSTANYYTIHIWTIWDQGWGR